MSVSFLCTDLVLHQIGFEERDFFLKLYKAFMEVSVKHNPGKSYRITSEPALR